MNLLITGAFAWTEEELNTLKEAGHKIIFMQQEKADLPCSPEWVEGVIGNGIFLYHSMEKFSSLRYIQLTSAGFDRVPMQYVKERNIEIFNAKGVYSIPMAEFALNGVLSLYKQNTFFEKNQKNHQWIKRRDIRELFGKRVCIVGCGNVGTECAKRFVAFGCKVFGVDVKPYEAQEYENILPLDNLDEALAISDVVVLTVPLTEETRGLINAERLAKIKKGAVLVNIARGAVVDQNALIVELETKRLGAVLDVFEEEPLKGNNPLWNMENVVITPHNSFVGEGNHERMRSVIFKNLETIK